jgi:hypothetical protein
LTWAATTNSMPSPALFVYFIAFYSVVGGLKLVLVSLRTRVFCNSRFDSWVLLRRREFLYHQVGDMEPAKEVFYRQKNEVDYLSQNWGIVAT